MIAQDTAKLREIISPQFALVSSENADRPQTRDAWLAAQRPPQTSAFSMRNVVVRVLARRPPWHRYPDLAIASFAAEVRGTAQREQAGTMFVTDIWRLDGNRWRVVARYTSRPQVPSVAAAPKRR